jgi:putative tricarboxylic transport membrane protein
MSALSDGFRAGPMFGVRRGPDWADVGCGLAVLAIAGLVIWGTIAIPTSPVYARVGPKLFPWIAGLGLLALGGALVASGAFGGWSDELEDLPREAPNPFAFGLILAALAVNVALIDTIGFVLAATIQFMLVCACFGSRTQGRDAATALLLSATAYLLFARALGVNIGSGWLEPWLNAGVDRLVAVFG